MSGAPILLLLVALWGAYLVPMLLARFERGTDLRSADRYRLAQRALSTEVGVGPLLPAAGGATPHERRRRALAALLGLVVGTAGIAVVGPPVLWVLQLLTDAALVLFVVHLRRVVLAEATARRRAPRSARPVRPAAAAAAARPSGARLLRRPELAWLPERLPGRATLCAAADRRGQSPASARSTSAGLAGLAAAAVSAAATAAAGAPPAPAPTAPASPAPAARRVTAPDWDDSSWLPVPVPAPLYASAPVAAPTVLDLTVPGAWTAAAVLAEIEAVAPVHDTTIEMQLIDETFVEHLRAVGD